MSDDRSTKQVIVIRKDLKMRKGKMVAQGAHASMKVFLDRGYAHQPDGTNKSYFTFETNWEIEKWLEGIFTKVCVGVNSELELLNVYDQAKRAGLPCSLIQDAGLTEFDGVPTYTAVAIGPADNEKVDEITGHFKLL
jgi:PTH2 family peptidyl-tRNA hydrolase